jgi:glutaredoxin 3
LKRFALRLPNADDPAGALDRHAFCSTICGPDQGPRRRREGCAGAENTMAKIEIYTTALCPYCSSAKALLEKKGAAYEETDVTFDPEKRKDVIRRSGRRTVPQIWIDGRHVGGCDDLYALDAEGKLDPLLKAAS